MGVSYGESIPLLALAARVGVTASDTDTAYGDAIRIADLGAPIHALIAQLNVTAAAKDAGDILNVALQTTFDGSTWTDVIAFTAVLGNGGAKRFAAKIDGSMEQQLDEDASAIINNATALAAGSVRNLIGESVRVKYAITNDADSTVDTTFTFSVTIVLL
jgi:hypothetical protein